MLKSKKHLIIWTLTSLAMIVILAILIVLDIKNQNNLYFSLQTVAMLLLVVSLSFLRISLNEYMNDLKEIDRSKVKE